MLDAPVVVPPLVQDSLLSARIESFYVPQSLRPITDQN